MPGNDCGRRLEGVVVVVVAGVPCGGGILVGGTGCRGRAGGTLCVRCSSVGVFGSGPVQFDRVQVDRVHDGGAVFVVGNRGLVDM